MIFFYSYDNALCVGTPIADFAGILLASQPNRKVTAKVVAHGRGPKIKIFKMRRRKHYQKHQGHRQNYTEIEISGIAA